MSFVFLNAARCICRWSEVERQKEILRKEEKQQAKISKINICLIHCHSLHNAGVFFFYIAIYHHLVPSLREERRKINAIA
jgi:hypothetical protein